MTGAFAGKDEMVQIKGTPEAEIKKTMKELRRKSFDMLLCVGNNALYQSVNYQKEE